MKNPESYLRHSAAEPAKSHVVKNVNRFFTERQGVAKPLLLPVDPVESIRRRWGKLTMLRLFSELMANHETLIHRLNSTLVSHVPSATISGKK